MRVLHLLKTTAGAAWALKLLREQVSLGIEVHVVLPDPFGKAKSYEEVGCTVHYLDVDLSVKKPWINIRNSSRLRRLIRAMRRLLVRAMSV